MQKAKSRTWILLAVLVLLGLAAVAERLRDRLSASTPLTTLGAHPHVLQVECPDLPPRTFERVQGRWQMRAPWRVPADAEAIDTLLAIARAPARFRYEDGRFDRAAFGLDAPVGVLDIDGTRIAIGGRDPVNGLRYVGIGKRAAAIRDKHSAVLSSPPEHFVDRHPLAGIHDIYRIADDDGDWPDVERQVLERAVAREVRPLDGAPQGHAIDVYDAHGQPWRYVFDASRGELARLTPPLAYALAPADIARLRQRLRETAPVPTS